MNSTHSNKVMAQTIAHIAPDIFRSIELDYALRFILLRRIFTLRVLSFDT